MPTPRPAPTLRVAAFLAAAALAVSACASDDKQGTGTAKPSTTAAPDTTSPETTEGSTAPDTTKGSSETSVVPVVDPGDGGAYEPTIDPAKFVTTIDNPYLPFLPGASWTYDGTSEDKPEKIEVTVLRDAKTVMGVPVVVVRDTVSIDGELVEDTYDWFAQDTDGNVWYFGEDVKDYENGEVVSTAGSWEGGVDGAIPGIVMPADPTVGKAFRQEFYKGEAEDMFEVLATDETTKAGDQGYDQVVKTEDWSPLEAEVVEHKYYAPGVGKVAGGKGHVELVSFTPGKAG